MIFMMGNIVRCSVSVSVVTLCSKERLSTTHFIFSSKLLPADCADVQVCRRGLINYSNAKLNWK